MRTMQRPVATASFGPFAAQLKVLILTLILLSIGCLLARTQVQNTPDTTLGRLMSSWFNSLPDSGGTIAYAGLPSAGSLVADQLALTAHARAMRYRQGFAGS